ncbi:mechanosensitive ion channel family protein [Natrarchaeobius halalkaliphilus]|uniref:Mechanosensitive ion channel family protein n=1 Tax=Natrarchaeobius halalkaliphilus TaxID=1679091 RepID=A0A3N6LIP9_9EURY|nr:mechanosensitive ion channel domain-containing protein [Natrarchaeobius halalkaliphilus]RQG87816.1 mechanosensitive ion channel family protein [Natrarchaeobius halalkaliphilus]
MFYNREDELEALSREHATDRFSFVVIYGRRRVGKTELIREFCTDRSHVYHLATQDSEPVQREKFINTLAAFRHERVPKTDDWDDAIEYLGEVLSDDDCIVAIDEFPSLVESFESGGKTAAERSIPGGDRSLRTRLASPRSRPDSIYHSVNYALPTPMTLRSAVSWSFVSGFDPVSLEAAASVGARAEALLGSILMEDTVSSLEQNWLIVVILLGGSALLARFIQELSRRYLDGESAETTFGRAVFAEIHSPVAISIAFLGVYLSLLVLDLVDSTPIIVGLIATGLVLLWARASIRIGRRWIEFLQDGETTHEFAPMFGNLWTILVAVGAVLLLISIWDLEVTPFLASAGLLGIVLGFAAQDAIGNLIGGVALYFDNTYKLGDVIRVDDDMRGTVTDVGIRSTTVLTEDNLLVTVPNAMLNSTQVVNESAPQRHMRLRIPITTAYGTDHELVEELALEVCETCPLVRQSPSPKLLFLEFGDSALVFELRVYINHPLVEKRAIDQINRGVYESFDRAGITIPFPQRELSFLDDGAETTHQFDEQHVSDGSPPERD